MEEAPARQGHPRRRTTVKLHEVVSRHDGSSRGQNERQDDNEKEDANDGKFRASKLFKQSGACLYLCMRDEERMDLHDALVSSVRRCIR